MHTFSDEISERDSALLDAIRIGDHVALGTLIELYSDALYRFAYVRTHDSALAEDVVQEVFISLWDRRNDIEIRDTLKGYLYQAVRFRSINAGERERSQDRLKASLAFIEVRSAQNDGDESVELAEAYDALAKAITDLPPRAREIFLLRNQQQMEYVEIARILNIGIPTVHNQMSRATHSIRAALERWKEGKK